MGFRSRAGAGKPVVRRKKKINHPACQPHMDSQDTKHHDNLFSSGRVPWKPSRWPTGGLSVEISTSTTYAWLLADDMAKAVLLRTAQPSTARRSTSKMGSRATTHTRS